MDRLIELLLDESKWLTTCMSVAILVVALGVRGRRRLGWPARNVVVWGMSLYFGCMIAGMAGGHLLAVAIKLAQGTLEGNLALLLLIGVVLAVPAVWLIAAVGPCARPGGPRKRLIVLNVALGVVLLALGLHNAPLALPAAFNIAYVASSRRIVGWLVLSAAVASTLLLFIGSLVFLASGQSFEQFRGL